MRDTTKYHRPAPPPDTLKANTRYLRHGPIIEYLRRTGYPYDHLPPPRYTPGRLWLRRVVTGPAPPP